MSQQVLLELPADITVDGTLLLDVTVRGLPIGQGAVRFLGQGRPAVHQNAKTLKPWRASVAAACEQVMGVDALPYDGPLALSAIFTMPKPVSAPKTRQSFPDRRPDLDHLVRAVADGMCHVAYVDDARLVDILTGKRYPGERGDALPWPGARLRLYRVGRG